MRGRPRPRVRLAMPPFDERRIDPTPDQLVAVLVAATKTANGWMWLRRVENDPSRWVAFIEGQRGHREGRQTFQGGHGGSSAPLVEASWWTDPAGRRHWRVIGRRAESEFPGWSAGRRDVLSAFPLWHIYPEHVGFRQVSERVEALAVCACGAAGEPVSIGWMGQRCGPCHDRLEEGLPPFPAAALPAGRIHQMVFTGDGGLLTGGRDGRVSLWNLADGSHRTVHHMDGPVQSLDVSTSGRVAFSATPDEVIVCGLDGERPRTIDLPSGRISALRFSTSGGLLVVLSEEGMFLLDLNAKDVAPSPLPGRHLHDWHFQPDGLACVFQEYGRGVVRLDLRTWEETPLQPPETPENLQMYYETYDEVLGLPLTTCNNNCSLAISPEGRWLAVDGGWYGSPDLHLADLRTGKWWGLPARATQAVRFTADGLLAAAEWGGGVRMWNPTTRKLEGTLYLPLGEHFWGLWAFPSDGDLMAFADHTGNIHVRPWRRLLQSEGHP